MFGALACGCPSLGSYFGFMMQSHQKTKFAVHAVHVRCLSLTVRVFVLGYNKDAARMVRMMLLITAVLDYDYDYALRSLCLYLSFCHC